MKRFLLSTMLLMSSTATLAADLTNVNDIVTKSNLAAYYPKDDGRAQARMIIVDEQGNKQLRQFTILRKDTEDGGQQDILVFFSRPSDVKGTVFRVVKKPSGDDDRWLYLPALDLVKRISAGDKRTSFVGSHFFYEDVSGRNPEEDNFTLLSTDEKFYTVRGEAKDKNSVEFDYYVANIDKQTFLPMEVTFFANTGKAQRKLSVIKTELIEGVATVTHSRIEQMESGSYTEMQFRGVDYDIGLPQSIFSERSLRTEPKQWLK